MLLDRILFHSHLLEDEKLIHVIHSHWFAGYKPITKVAFFGMLIPVLFYLLFPTETAFLIFGVWFLLGSVKCLYAIMDWYFDVLLITDRGVIDLDWRGIFDKSSTRVDYSTVVGVSYEKIGFWANMLNFGYLEVEKEGHGDEQIELPQAANPQRAEKLILDTRERYMHEQGLEDEKVLKDILAGMVKNHVRREREGSEKLADMI